MVGLAGGGRKGGRGQPVVCNPPSAPKCRGKARAGQVATLAGQKVNAGDLLLTIEAMKMETGIHADRAATIKALHVHPGSMIEAKDLLVELG